jgi:large subunit ribosomal protein L4
MINITVHNLEGKEVSKKSIDNSIFDISTNDIVLSQAINHQLNQSRASIAHTKTRGEVSGGGRKPFKQKGTGNARAGSTRSPLWIGGGVTFGPRNIQNHKNRINQNINRLAIKTALSEKVKNKKIIVLEKLEMPEISTKQVYAMFSKLPFEEGKILVIMPKIDVNTELSLSNIPYTKVIKAENLNIKDLLKYDYILTSITGIEKIEEVFGSKTKVVK